MTPDQAALVGLAEDVLGAAEPRWADVAASGLVGVAVPEEHGGSGLGLAEMCLVLEVLGRRLAPVPLWEAGVAGLVLAHRGGGDRGGRLAALCAGGSRLTHAESLSLVPDGMGADAVLLATGDAVVLADLTGAKRVPVTTTAHRVAADVVLAEGGTEPVDPTGADFLRARSRVALAAVQLGVAGAGVVEAAAYVTGREQFGRPLGAFQAVSQQLADAYGDVQAMRATLWQAVWALDHAPPGEARRSLEVAVWWAVEAGARVQTTVQHLHGGLGADVTYPVHRRLLWSLEACARLGPGGAALGRLADEILA